MNQALTYMEMCLWDDTKLVVDEFYKQYQKSYGAVKHLLRGKGKDYNSESLSRVILISSAVV